MKVTRIDCFAELYLLKILIIIFQLNIEKMKNMGTIDRIIRVIVAIAIGLLYFMNLISGTLAIVLLIAGGIFLLTSLASTCPLYLPFGINTCKVKDAK